MQCYQDILYFDNMAFQDRQDRLSYKKLGYIFDEICKKSFLQICVTINI